MCHATNLDEQGRDVSHFSGDKCRTRARYCDCDVRTRVLRDLHPRNILGMDNPFFLYPLLTIRTSAKNASIFG